MKHLKSKLMVAIAMLAISAVMLTGVSFAWYTLSTNPEVSNIKANIAANENLEIALDNGYADGAAVDAASVVGSTTAQGSTTGDPYTWGNLIDLTTAMTALNEGTGATNANPQLTLTPVKYDTSGNKLQYPKYGTDGRVASTNNDLTAKYISDYSKSGTAKGTTAGVAAWMEDATNGKSADALSVTYWLRANETCTVALSAAAKRAGSTNDASATTSDVNGVMGGGSTVTVPITGENTTTAVEAYMKNLVIQFNVGTNTYYAKMTKNTTKSTTASLVYDLSLWDKKTSAITTDAPGTAKTISLTANTAQKVVMYMYLDGESVTNASALLDDLTGMTVNIQFSSNETDGPGAMNGTTTS